MLASSLQLREGGMARGGDGSLEMLLEENGEGSKPESFLKVMKQNDDETENSDGFLNLEAGHEWDLGGDDDASCSLNGSASPSLQPVTPPTSDSSATAIRKTVSSWRKTVKPGKSIPPPASIPDSRPSSSAKSRGAPDKCHSSRAIVVAARKTLTPTSNRAASSSLDRSSSLRKPASPETNLRPASASRGRPNSGKVNPRQQSCSPSRLRNDYRKPGNMVASRSKGCNAGSGDEVNPVLIGTKMVERVVNMRKLAPPKEEQRQPRDHDKKPSKGNSGFGRSFSQKSLEMAIRHMDIRRSIPDDFARTAGASHAGRTQSKFSGMQVHSQKK